MNLLEAMKFGFSILWERHIAASEYRAHRMESSADITIPSALSPPLEVQPGMVQVAFAINAALLEKERRPRARNIPGIPDLANLEEEFHQFSRFDRSRWSWLFPTLKVAEPETIELRIK